MIRNMFNCGVKMETKCSGISFSESTHKMSTTKFSSNPEQSTDVHRPSIFSSLNHATSTPPVNQTSRFCFNFPRFASVLPGVHGILPPLGKNTTLLGGCQGNCVKLLCQGPFEVCTKQSYLSQQKHTYLGNSHTSIYI